MVFPLPGGPETVTARPTFNPPEITESSPGIPVFTLEYVESNEKFMKIFYIKRKTSLILTNQMIHMVITNEYFRIFQSDSKSNFIEYTIEWEFVHIANGSSLEFAFFVKNNISLSSLMIKHR